MNKKFYSLDIPGDQYAVAVAAEGVPFTVFPKQGWISDWPPPQFFIPKNDGIISDYMFSDVGGRLCSDKLKNIIDTNKGSEDVIQWLSVDIFHEDTAKTIRYHHLYFPEPQDCLSERYTIWDKFGKAMVPWYLFEDIKKKEIFNSARGYERSLTILSDKILKAIEEDQCTGLTLEPANVIYDDKDDPKQAAS